MVFVDKKSFDTHRTARMRLVGAHANLGAETVTESIGKSRGGVPIDSGGVHFLQETASGLRAFGPHRIGVCRSIAMDMLNGFIDAVDDMNRHDQVQEFMAEVGLHMQIDA